MALIKKWPANAESDLDNKQWVWNEWPTGTPITQGKLENLENGVAILATQISAIFAEMDTSTYSKLINNASRLDKIQSWITGNSAVDYTNTNISDRIDTLAGEIWGSNGADQASRIDNIQTWITGSNTASYDGTNIVSRLNSIDTLNGQQNTRLTNIETVNTTQTNDINALKTRATNIENLNNTQNGRLDNIETKNSNQDSRLENIETLNTTQNGRLESLETRTTNIESINTSQNNKLTAIENLNTNQNTRLDNIETHDTSIDKAIAAIKNELGGTYVENSGFTNSRINLLESTSTSYGTRLTNIENKNTAQDNKLAAIMNELGGTGNDGSNTTYGGTSRLDTAITEIWGSNTTTGNSRIGAIETLNTTQNTRLDSIEALNIAQNGRLDNVESKNSAQDNKLTAIATEIWGSDTISGDSKLDTIITELYGSNDTTITSRLDDLEKEICGETIERTINGTGYENSRIDSLELKVGNGAIGTDADISAAIRRLSGTVTALDPTGSAEATSFLVSEVWGNTFSEDTDFTANSRIDILETTTQNLGTQLTTLATEQSTLEQNLEETKAKIPIEMYIATNSSASDTVVLNAIPQDKSIFFIAVPRGTLGTNNLILQTNDIQFNNVIVKKTYNGEGIKIKYAPNSLISIYRNGSNAYAYNVPMVL